jgi:hypothetical protein
MQRRSDPGHARFESGSSGHLGGGAVDMGEFSGRDREGMYAYVRCVLMSDSEKEEEWSRSSPEHRLISLFTRSLVSEYIPCPVSIL